MFKQKTVFIVSLFCFFVDKAGMSVFNYPVQSTIGEKINTVRLIKVIAGVVLLWSVALISSGVMMRTDHLEDPYYPMHPTASFSDQALHISLGGWNFIFNGIDQVDFPQITLNHAIWSLPLKLLPYILRAAEQGYPSRTLSSIRTTADIAAVGIPLLLAGYSLYDIGHKLISAAVQIFAMQKELQTGQCFDNSTQSDPEKLIKEARERLPLSIKKTDNGAGGKSIIFSPDLTVLIFKWIALESAVRGCRHMIVGQPFSRIWTKAIEPEAQTPGIYNPIFERGASGTDSLISSVSLSSPLYSKGKISAQIVETQMPLSNIPAPVAVNLQESGVNFSNKKFRAIQDVVSGEEIQRHQKKIRNQVFEFMCEAHPGHFALTGGQALSFHHMDLLGMNCENYNALTKDERVVTADIDILSASREATAALSEKLIYLEKNTNIEKYPISIQTKLYSHGTFIVHSNFWGITVDGRKDFRTLYGVDIIERQDPIPLGDVLKVEFQKNKFVSVMPMSYELKKMRLVLENTKADKKEFDKHFRRLTLIVNEEIRKQQSYDNQGTQADQGLVSLARDYQKQLLENLPANKSKPRSLSRFKQGLDRLIKQEDRRTPPTVPSEKHSQSGYKETSASEMPEKSGFDNKRGSSPDIYRHKLQKPDKRKYHNKIDKAKRSRRLKRMPENSDSDFTWSKNKGYLAAGTFLSVAALVSLYKFYNHKNHYRSYIPDSLEVRTLDELFKLINESYKGSLRKLNKQARREDLTCEPLENEIYLYLCQHYLAQRRWLHVLVLKKVVSLSHQYVLPVFGNRVNRKIPFLEFTAEKLIYLSDLPKEELDKFIRVITAYAVYMPLEMTFSQLISSTARSAFLCGVYRPEEGEEDNLYYQCCILHLISNLSADFDYTERIVSKDPEDMYMASVKYVSGSGRYVVLLPQIVFVGSKKEVTGQPYLVSLKNGRNIKLQAYDQFANCQIPPEQVSGKVADFHVLRVLPLGKSAECFYFGNQPASTVVYISGQVKGFEGYCIWMYDDDGMCVSAPWCPNFCE